ncbi:class I SAM-dependent methyltransferase [Sulfurimonas sp.]|jgi:hypothetical protein|uniref:class I SAM-dependent methyltransferase n=1 Tax=Sulfurimonas sp. TaxID=2022749 RepID=UPI0025CEC1DA|nr:class I SAM-dependent methyltransferase [Sulfurimonas sp.]MCK9472256.1 class I SAM-dependent methyltransferase [Sulfurimonas sp.]
MLNIRGFEREKELPRAVYFSNSYFTKSQLFSLSEQIYLIYKYAQKCTKPKILEIGKGNGFVSDFFKKAEFDFLTYDINKNLLPDIEGNILELSHIVNHKVDIVVACEILEHLPFDMFEDSLKEISKVTNKYVVITLPEFKKFFGFGFLIRLPKLEMFSKQIMLKLKANKILSSEHFWEIDYDIKTQRKNIESIIYKYFSIVEKGSFDTNPYHNYYVLEKKMEQML